MAPLASLIVRLLSESLSSRSHLNWAGREFEPKEAFDQSPFLVPKTMPESKYRCTKG
jgi:hypothetical protein